MAITKDMLIAEALQQENGEEIANVLLSIGMHCSDARWREEKLSKKPLWFTA